MFPIAVLQRPDLVHTSPLKPLGWLAARGLLRQGAVAAHAANYQPNIAVLIRTKNNRVGLSRILNHVQQERQTYKGRIDVIVVDTESKDRTKQLAEEFGAQVVPITQAEFTYPKSVNFGLDVVKADVEATFITVGHAQPCLSNCLSAGARHFTDKKIAGVFANNLPSEYGNWQNKLSLNVFALKLNQPAYPIQKFYLGALANTGSMIRMSLWRQHHYSDAYAGGGEDQEWGRWALSQGYKLIYEPAMAMHHGHPLGFMNNLRQNRHWREIYETPTEFNQNTMTQRRPELFK